MSGHLCMCLCAVYRTSDVILLRGLKNRSLCNVWLPLDQVAAGVCTSWYDWP